MRHLAWLAIVTLICGCGQSGSGSGDATGAPTGERQGSDAGSTPSKAQPQGAQASSVQDPGQDATKATAAPASAPAQGSQLPLVPFPATPPGPTTVTPADVRQALTALDRTLNVVEARNPLVAPNRGILVLNGSRQTAASCSGGPYLGFLEGDVPCDPLVTRCTAGAGQVVVLEPMPDGGRRIFAIVNYEDGAVPAAESEQVHDLLTRRDRICEATDALIAGDRSLFRGGFWNLGFVEVSGGTPVKTATPAEAEAQRWVTKNLPSYTGTERYVLDHFCGPDAPPMVLSAVASSGVSCSMEVCQVGMPGNATSMLFVTRDAAGALQLVVAATAMTDTFTSTVMTTVGQHLKTIPCP